MIRNRAAERRGHSRRSWAARAVNESLVRRRSSTLRASAASTAAWRCGHVSTSSIRRSKPQASTNRRAVASVGLVWPASCRAMAERDVSARLGSSVRVSPARLRARRITDPSIVAIASRYPIASRWRKPGPSRAGAGSPVPRRVSRSAARSWPTVSVGARRQRARTPGAGPSAPRRPQGSSAHLRRVTPGTPAPFACCGASTGS